jgi:hypothetical protein
VSHWISVRLRFTAATAFALAWNYEGGAQSENAGARTEAPSPDAIAGAKEEFESLKSVRDAALLPNGVLPRVSLPEFHGPTPPAASAPKTKAITPEAKSPNWLVDAMQKQDDSRDLRGRDSRLSGRRNTVASPSEGNATSGQKDARAASERDVQQTESENPLVINPLTRYLGDWMTPQDLALLKPGLAKSFDPGVDAKSFSSVNASELPLTLGGLNEFAFAGSSSSTPPGLSPPPRENPYLESFKPDANGSGIPIRPSSISAPPVRAPIPNAILSTPQTPPAPPRIPEFAKPPTDDKYFKQLKRF